MAAPMQDQIHTANGKTIERIETAESVSLPIPRDLFEKLYLNPKHDTQGKLYRRFGNPTPVALMGFMLSAFPTGAILMGWRGAGGNGGAILPVYIWFGGVVQILAAMAEWLMGNTFSCCLFFTYGTFWLVHGTAMIPGWGVGVNYSPTGNNLEGQLTPEFAATSGFFYVFLGVVSLVYLVCSIRTNIIFVFGLFDLIIIAGLFTGIEFQLANGNIPVALKLQKAAGALTFVLGLLIFYLFAAEIMESVDFPLVLPVGDLSQLVLGRSERREKLHQGENSSEKAV